MTFVAPCSGSGLITGFKNIHVTELGVHLTERAHCARSFFARRRVAALQHPFGVSLVLAECDTAAPTPSLQT